MSCSGQKELISRYLDEEVSLKERELLFAHVSNCPACAAVLARYRAMEITLRRLPATQPSPIVREKLLREICQRAGSQQSRLPAILWFQPKSLGANASGGRRLQLIIGSLAAVAIVAIAGLGILVQAGSTDPLGSRDRMVRDTMAFPQVSFAGDDATALVPVIQSSQLAAALEQILLRSRTERPRRLPLPTYLPAGMRLERFSLVAASADQAALRHQSTIAGELMSDRGAAIGEAQASDTVTTGQLNMIEDMDVAFRTPDGRMVRIRHVVAKAQPVASQTAKRINLGGKEWWVERHPAPPSNGAPAYIVYTKRGDEVIVLDAVLPLDELLRIVASIEWSEEER